MPPRQPSHEPHDSYPFASYLESVNAYDVELLSDLAHVVGREIDEGARPFAATALDLAVKNPPALIQLEQSKPRQDVEMSKARAAVIWKEMEAATGIPPNPFIFAEIIHDRVQEEVKRKHTIGVAACSIARLIGQSNLLPRVSILPRPTSVTPIHPTRPVQREIQRQHIDPRYKEYVVESAKARSGHEQGSLIVAKNRLLVAVAAYAVRQSRQD